MTLDLAQLTVTDQEISQLLPVLWKIWQQSLMMLVLKSYRKKLESIYHLSLTYKFVNKIDVLHDLYP